MSGWRTIEFEVGCPSSHCHRGDVKKLWDLIALGLGNRQVAPFPFALPTRLSGKPAVLEAPARPCHSLIRPLAALASLSAVVVAVDELAAA